MNSTRGPDAWPLGGSAGRGRPRGMGRGLAAIMAVSTDPGSEVEEFRQIAVELIFPNPRQPRRHFDDEALAALAASMESRGMLQPVLVRPLDDAHFELIAGERRWRAAQLAGLETIPALVRARDDAESLELALIENMAREDLNPVEEARACAALVEELGLSREEVGLRIGRSRVAVSNLVRLLDLPDEALELLERGVAQRGPRPRAADRHRPRRPPPPRPQRRRRGLVGARARGACPRGQPRHSARRAGTPAGRASFTPTRSPRAPRSATRSSGALGTEVHVAVARGGAYRAELTFDSPEQALELAARLNQA